MHRRGKRGRRCVYCGAWCRRGVTCEGHSDLLLLDPQAYLRVSSRPMQVNYGPDPSGTWRAGTGAAGARHAGSQAEDALSQEGKATR